MAFKTGCSRPSPCPGTAHWQALNHVGDNVLMVETKQKIKAMCPLFLLFHLSEMLLLTSGLSSASVSEVADRSDSDHTKQYTRY